MQLFEFLERFSGEKECIDYLVETHLRIGIVCPICGCNKHVWHELSSRFECLQCHNFSNIKSETLMKSSILPIKYWFIAIQLLTSETDASSLYDINAKLGRKNIDQINSMMSQLRNGLEDLNREPTFDNLLELCLRNSKTIDISKSR